MLGMTPATWLPVTVGVAPMNDPDLEVNGVTVGVCPMPTGERLTLERGVPNPAGRG
jgi:hypothetical protein